MDLFDGVCVYANMGFMRLALLLSVAGMVWGQAKPAKLEFEVASIKSAPSNLDPSVQVGLHVDGAQVHISRLSLKDYLTMAYGLKLYQVSGPDWIGSTRFDIDAKLPEGGTRDQVPEMLQSLLTERFQMKVHREQKDFPVYALVVMPGGPKIQPVKEDASDGSDPAKAAVQVQASGGPQGLKLSYGPGSYFTFADNKFDGKKLAMVNFVDILGRFSDRPVIDVTNLQGRYDITMDLTPEEYRAMLIRSAVAAGVTLPPQALQALQGSDGSMFSALKPLGLKLESRKAPVEVLVVDSANKMPAEN
jgi:uncharacterized protein (TIGR03435 family)